MMSARNWIFAAVILVTAGVLAVAVGGSDGTPGGDTGTPTARATSDGATPGVSATGPLPTATATEGFETFRSEEARLEIAYPAGWTVLDSPDEEVVLVATPNGTDSVLLRTVPLETEVTAEDLPQMQQLTDRIVRSGEGVEVLVGPREVTLAGQAGYYYLYRFLDEDSGQQGAHAHYFVFDGSRMVVLVFQALPDDRFEDLADTFDRIAASLRILPA